VSFLHAASEDIVCTEDRSLAEEPSKRVVAHYQITGLVGKAYLKLATAAVAADGFQKTCLFPYICHIFDKHDPGRISAQHYLLFA